MNKIQVDLGSCPVDRWRLEEKLVRQTKELISFYLDDIGLSGDGLALIDDALLSIIPGDYLNEIEGLARQCELSSKELVAGNLYYDFMKMVFGCTAFSAPTPDGPFHCRNLDWLAEERALSRFTLVTEFINGPCGKFITVGWPGVVGALSGVANGRFAITLNAAMSSDKVDMGFPIAFLIRSV
ncbi:MAG: hypothetical protein OQK04_05195, partial [Kangiellaceae bacterium]|nr:hypothetical protein [Kangiellaceae bacterium]